MSMISTVYKGSIYSKYSAPTKKAKKKKNRKRKSKATAQLQQQFIAKTDIDAIKSDNFLQSFSWRKLRMQALKLYGAKCQCCGSTPATGAVMNVDHVKPRKTHPELALELTNLQILCHECNHGKGNWDSTDWRNKNV